MMNILIGGFVVALLITLLMGKWIGKKRIRKQPVREIEYVVHDENGSHVEQMALDAYVELLEELK